MGLGVTPVLRVKGLEVHGRAALDRLDKPRRARLEFCLVVSLTFCRLTSSESTSGDTCIAS